MVAAVLFSDNPNSSEAVIEIHRESRGLREMWVAKPFCTSSLPLSDHPRLHVNEILLRFLSPKDPDDPEEYEDSRGIERALVDLWHILDGNSGSLFLIDTEYWAPFNTRTFCAELASKPIAIRGDWPQLEDRLREDESWRFNADVESYDIPWVPKMSWEAVISIPPPIGVLARTGITVNSNHWIMLVGNSADAIPVPFSVRWVPLDGGVSEPRFVPYVDLSPLDCEPDLDRPVWTGSAPAGNTLIFEQSHAGDAGSIQVESALLPRPHHEDLWE